ncbi:MAG TPA: cytochrome c [Candidatus Eremiobacteraceae bacterium]|nr:cytochrome c [Candidatus Eremiobacteraceae bacterium]
MRRFIPGAAVMAAAICLAALAPSSAAAAENDAAKTYAKNCVLCHAVDGSGSSPSGKALKAKDLASSEVQKKPDEDLIEVVTKGKGKMPAFGKKISPEEIKGLVAYIRALPNKK